MKKLFIIGNQSLARREIFIFKKKQIRFLKEQIDKADFVVRINSALHCNGIMGTKTDCLALISTGTPAIEFSYKYKINPVAVSNAKSVLFTRPQNPVDLKATIGFPLICRQDMSANILDFQNLSNKKVNYITEKNYQEMANLVGEQYLPSSGLTVFNHFLNDIVYQDYEINIAGFSWEGWHGHNWKVEKEFIKQFEKAGRLKINML